MLRSRFITLEGGEGGGKSTHAAQLALWLEGQGQTVVRTREPGGTPGAEEIRALLVQGEAGRWDALTETLLHFAARRDHVEKVVKPALARGAFVVCDRFVDSTVAYQGYGHGLGADRIAALARYVLDDFAPGLTLLFDVPVAVGLQRAGARRGIEGRYESMGTDFHARVREGFLAIARAAPERVVVIDATVPLAAVATAAQAALALRFPGLAAA